jgi:hypothetical protein
MDVRNELKVYEDNKSRTNIRIPIVTIESHTDKDFVVLRLGQGTVLTLLANDLIKAVHNSTNK